VTSEIQVLVWDRHTNVVGLNWLMGSQPSPLDNLVSHSNAYVLVCTDKPQQTFTMETIYINERDIPFTKTLN
jgi:hypothetical protein